MESLKDVGFLNARIVCYIYFMAIKKHAFERRNGTFGGKMTQTVGRSGTDETGRAVWTPPCSAMTNLTAP